MKVLESLDRYGTVRYEEMTENAVFWTFQVFGRGSSGLVGVKSREEGNLQSKSYDETLGERIRGVFQSKFRVHFLRTREL